MKGARTIAAISIWAMATGGFAQQTRYEPTWESVDSRPTPQWFSDAKLGIFIHWGVYSVPAWGPKDQYSEWYWNRLTGDLRNKEKTGKIGPTLDFHLKAYGENVKYQDFAPMFRAEMYDPAQWAGILAGSGARYIVLTSKHHDGFCLWPSAESWNWNSMDVGPHRDLAGDLVEACRKANLRIGFYYSLYEWYHPLYLRSGRAQVDRYVDQHMLPQIKDLVTRYKPDIVWGDGEWDHPSEVWRSTEFLAWLFNESPCKDYVAVNDRWGKETRGKHGSYYTTEYFKVHKDTVVSYDKPWEECRGMGHSFGYNRNEDLANYRKPAELIHMLIEIVCRGGNLLLDIGPTADGRIPVIMEERLSQIGDWLKVNGEAIYEARRWRETHDGERVRYTCKNDVVYAICLGWPGNELVLSVPKPAESAAVAMLGYDKPLKWRSENGKMVIEVPPLSVDEVPCLYAYSFRLTGVK